MTNPESVIIDDVDAAVTLMTDLGKRVVGPVARLIRDGILLYAGARHTPVAHHSSFVKWAEMQATTAELWLVVDPLFPTARLGPQALQVRFTRTLGSNGLTIDSGLPPAVASLVSGREVSVLDDSTLTGGTFRHLERLVSDSAGRVTRFVVCASTGAGRSAVHEVLPSSQFVQFVAGDFMSVHLRDGCPCLPYAGRRLQGNQGVMTTNGLVATCFPPTVFRGAWQLMALDRSVRETLRAARRNLALRFSSALGRPATISDIPLLGADIAMPLYPNQRAVADTRLDTLLV